jgi:hypothetical protein
MLDCFVTRHFGRQWRMIRHGASAGRFRNVKDDAATGCGYPAFDPSI